MSEETEAVTAVAKTTGKIADGLREFSRFAARYVGDPLVEVSGIVTDKLKYFRWENRINLMIKGNAFLEEKGLKEPTRAIPLKFALPLLEAASLEDDDSLQNKWAMLLVNFADKDSGVEINRTYIDILERLSPLEVKILQVIYSLPYDDIRLRGVTTCKLPERAGNPPERKPETPNGYGEPSREIVLALSNLTRLGCLSAAGTLGGGQTFSLVIPTLLGKTFVEACTI